MKKFVCFIFIILVLIFTYFFLSNENDVVQILSDVDEEFNVDNYFIFGTHFSLSGCIDKNLSDKLQLVLKNKNKEIKVDSNFKHSDSKTCFYLSENNNEGIYLDDLEEGTYLLLVKSDNKYYTLKNNTEYGNLEYYTITRNNSNNKINISFNNYNKKSYIKFEIKREKLPRDVYDITLDPGHGGKDVGSSYKTYYESNLVLAISLLVKEELEDIGLKVKMTRNTDTYLDPYGTGGRALIPNDVKSKYSLSIHLNSSIGKMNYGGVEIYVPNDVNYTFAQTLADNISSVVGYSKKPTNKVSNGVYFNYFTLEDIKSSNEEIKTKGMIPYDIKVGSPYMYMIREVGGISTNAYIDGRNEYYGLNDYYNSNSTAEPYLLELAYINYNNDLEKLINNKEQFSKAISNAIKEYLDIS